MRLLNRIAVITGAAAGIGLATARAFASEGAKLVLVDRDHAALKEAGKSLSASDITMVEADVTQADQVERYVAAAVRTFGGIDVFVNNAGIEGVVKPIAEYPVDRFDEVLSINIRGVWLGLRYAIPAMAGRANASIIMSSSIAGLKGTAGTVAYTTSKHAIIGMMRVAAVECAAQGIRVNTVNPGPIETRMMRSLEEGFAPGAAQAAKADIMGRIPMRRYGTADEVAKLMLFLASDDSAYCTGGVYTVDGGMSAI